jgi:hypothetical protein
MIPLPKFRYEIDNNEFLRHTDIETRQYENDPGGRDRVIAKEIIRDTAEEPGAE